jgi:hypothetical protein
VLVIDGKKSSEPNLESAEDEHRAEIWSFQIARSYHEGNKEACAGFLRICEFAEGIKLRRNNEELHAERKCAPGPRLTSMPKLRRDSVFQKRRRDPKSSGLAEGAKVETLEHLENLLSQRDQKLRRKSDSGRWITDPEDQQPLD